MSLDRRRFFLAGLIAAAALAPAPARADKHAMEQDALRDAVENGEVRPLADILDAVRGQMPGKIVGVHAEREHGRWTYEFRVLDDKGRLFEVYIDAGSGHIERVKEK